jgi:hypothetical protein
VDEISWTSVVCLYKQIGMHVLERWFGKVRHKLNSEGSIQLPGYPPNPRITVEEETSFIDPISLLEIVDKNSLFLA